MSKLRNGRPVIAPRQCLFCTNLASSPEHVWSDWMRPFFKRGAHDKSVAVYTKRNDPDWPQEFKVKHGHTTTLKIKAVCKDCNHHWMSGLEDAVKPLLAPMMMGTHLTTGVHEQHILAAWITLKLMVLDRFDGMTGVFDREVCERFKLYRTIPAGLNIWLFSSGHGGLFSMFDRETALVVPDPPDPSLSPVGANLQGTMIGIGRVLVHAVYSKVDDFDFRLVPDPGFRWDLWPLHPDPFFWPMPKTITPAGAYEVGRTVERFGERVGMRVL